ncbi:MNIO family bufferin maturase [Oceanibaculum pacificum]|uniref:Uncharacterized protein n=1 Tax=Oceanibaculum pacificum TaxID=580166 RepID=A0A154W341_9PROT|nr:DUF692 domain-containing protein [Oceanibaculum pacificum]KZD07863.1 hypothetical protein AUP43_09585 [Oceanibaculum pacificum]
MVPAAIPARAGVGFKLEHFPAIRDSAPAIGWFEAHAENFMVAGGPRPRILDALRRNYPLSLHGVGLSLGSADRPDVAHLATLRALIERYDPGLVSEHLAWVGEGGDYFADLLPVPMTHEALALIARNIDIAQEALGRRMLIENPANYLRFEQAEMAEADFLAELVRRTGCGLLLDVNNLYVSHRNAGIDIGRYLAALPGEAIGEIHLAGHVADGSLLIDTHSTAVPEPVLALFADIVARFGPRPTLIEWDNDLPAWEVLLAEAETAERLLRRSPVDA